MAERKCQLCQKTFKTTKTLKGHYLKAHGLSKDDDIVLTTPKSPKKRCQFCSKDVSNIWAHRSSCRARPKDGGEEATTPVKSGSGQPSGGQPSGGQPSTSTQQATEEPIPERSTRATDAVPERMTNEEFLLRYRRWLESANGNFAGGCISFHHPFPFKKLKSFPEACISFCFQ